MWSGIALHTGIGVVYPFPVFSGLMISIYVGLLPDHCYAPLRWLDMRMSRLAAGLGVGSQQSAVPLRPSPRLLVCVVGLWVLLIAGSYAPDVPRLSYSIACKLGLESRLAQPQPSVAGNASSSFTLKLARGIFVGTGITTHAVFGDGSFSHYTYQMRLTPVGASGYTAPMPYSRDGLFAWSVRDRAWEDWWKHTQAPWVPLRESESRLAAWADFYWHPSSDWATVRIEARPQQVELNTIDTALFSRNSAVPWHPVGSIRINHSGVAQITWTDPRRSGEDLLGDYMSRVMTEHSY